MNTYKPPLKQNVKRYIDMMIDEKSIALASDNYCPIAKIPKDTLNRENALTHLFELQDHGNGCGGENAYKYIIEELVDNIYQHSKFKNAFVMAQSYPIKGFIEICFYDNGVSIQGAYRDHELNFDALTALSSALNGLSTKSKERGFGLGSTVGIVTQLLKGKWLIVSSSAAISIEKGIATGYKLSDDLNLDGTLISIRLPLTSEKFDIYSFLNGIRTDLSAIIKKQ
ncbi:hypothetical protein HY989_04195 [Candidatus Micrarchaeota archaeon]|nr:hypothetical protein [Candidatus Micrarchaeota archaeon]